MPVSPQDIENTLSSAIPVSYVEVKDQSSGCGESYAVFVVSEAFEGKMTLARHRMVNEILKEQISQLHAFSQTTLTPAQYVAKKAKEAASPI
ncbi:bola-like protein [Rickenella mellea]|uniref:Bola-like protein n=1 Tax=Rickenella mellea TaxID=50990 RepID=A0A4Y7QIH8_9AGAM|nr:bola-like protein [Rickenella mellea]